MPEPTSDQTPGSAQVPAQAANPPADAAAIEAAIVNELFDGKYNNLAEARKGYWELNRYASQAYEALQAQVQPAPRQDPYQVLEKDALVNPDALRQAIRAEASQMISQELGPLMGTLSARQQMATDAPDYLAHEGDVLKWVGQNRQVANEVASLNNKGLYSMAAKWAYSQWQAANPPANGGDAAAKAQAALQAGQTGGGRPDLGPPSDDLRRQAIEYGNRTGDRRAAYASVFPDFKVVLPPHVADQLRR